MKFPEFIFMVLKATEYIQTTNLMSDGESNHKNTFKKQGERGYIMF